MKVRFGRSRGRVLAVAALAAIVASTVPGAAPASAATGSDGSGLADAITSFVTSTLSGVAQATDGGAARSEHWGVITRNTIGSPVAALRNGPYGSYGGTGDASEPPYGTGSLGIEVADNSTSQSPGAEKVDFGNEVDFYGDSVLDLEQVGFHVFQTSENVSNGGPTNLPGIRFEIDPNVGTGQSDNYSVLVWQPDAVPVASLNRWSPYLDATTSGTWYLTGGETSCTQGTPCTFTGLKQSLDDGGNAPTILTASISKGRDHLWVGAVDGLRINDDIYDFEAGGVNARRVGRG
ncbi:hypothetical protein [Kitasatospora sp. NBC_00315]|uniref:hypothetical protein n=1 Tax=Kitasatospora sp. NBC_00315 TaxID=2975963 RepID=UPI003247CF57